MRERDMEGVMKNDKHEGEPVPAGTRESGNLPIRSSKANPEKAVEDLQRYMDEKGRLSNIVLFKPSRNAPQRGGGSYRLCDGLYLCPAQGGQHRHAEFPAVCQGVEEELIAKGNCNLKGIRLFWNVVDRRGRKDLYDAWNRVIHRMGLRLLSSHIPNTLRYDREADPVCKGIFRSTLFPPDP